MARVKIFSTATCPICVKTKTLLTKWQIPYEEVMVDQDRAGLKEFAIKAPNAKTVPQILIDDLWIGGFTELTELHMEGKLEELIEA